MSALAFELPKRCEAQAPAEERGSRRDGVALLVARRGDAAIEHRRFDELPDILSPGDLLVVNVSATLPAALDARRADGAPAVVHVSTRVPRLEPAFRVVELRSDDGTEPAPGKPGEGLELAGGGQLRLVAPYLTGARLHLARLHVGTTVEEHLEAFGRPIRYRHAASGWPLRAYQNVYATVPGSAEMPSAGRPFTEALVTRLIARGVLLAPVTVHAGVSSPEAHEPPFPEQFDVPAVTAHLVEVVRQTGGRVVAVGTTVVRALETAARRSGRVRPGAGWTSLIVEADDRLRAVDGLITGWHEPESSHLDMLSAIAGPELLARSYAVALERGYLWHEFGDSHLILP